MADYRDEQTPPRVHYNNTVQPERSGSSIFLIVGAVIALLAILWFAFSGGDSAMDTAAPPAVESTAPATGDTAVTPTVPDATMTTPEATPAPAPTTPAPAQ
ncbi:hypothetical protein QCN27_13835 [Cereibacter sp. SYSU M97828]|nr:hypothetical protein [Cereibacter flavus]